MSRMAIDDPEELVDLLRQVAQAHHALDDEDALAELEQGYGLHAAGFVIHSAVHSARDDAHCIIHTHTLAGMTVSAMKGGILPIAF